MAIDIFADNNIKSDQPTDIFADNGINPFGAENSNSQDNSASQQLLNQLPNESQQNSNNIPDHVHTDVATDFLRSIKNNGNRTAWQEMPELHTPRGALNSFLQAGGAALSLANPELMAAPGLIPGIVNSLARIGTGTAATTAMNAPNINSLQDLKNSALDNLKWNSLMEIPSAGIKGIGGTAELINPQKYAEQQANNIQQGFNEVSKRRDAAYAPVNAAYNDKIVTNKPEQFLNFDPKDEQYFTGDVRRSVNTFNDNPTFQNLHKLQSQMGKDWSKVSTNSNKIDQAQALEYSRNNVNDKLRDYLSSDPKMLAQYEKGQQISKEEYYPYLSSDNLKSIAQGRRGSIDGSQIVKDIVKGREKEFPSIPANHPLNEIADNLQNKMSRGQAMQYIIPSIAGMAGGEMLHPGYGGVLSGLMGGIGVGHYIEPGLLKVAQNPWVQNAMRNLGKIYYPVARDWIGNSR